MGIFIFGDSIACGVLDSKGGWVNRLIADDFANEVAGLRKARSIYNLSFDGDMAADIAARIEFEVEHRKRWGVDLIIIAVGINDARIEYGKPACDTRQYSSALAEILELTRQFTNKIAFVSISSIDENRTRPVSWGNTIELLQDRIDIFNDTLKIFCDEKGASFIDIHTAFRQKSKTQELLFDGAHPNDAGHELIANIVKPEIEKLLQ